MNTKYIHTQTISLQEQEQLLALQRDALLSYVTEEIQKNPLIQLDSLFTATSAPLIESSSSNLEKELENPGSSLWESLKHQALCYRATPLRDLLVALIPFLDEKGYIRESREVLCQTLSCTSVELEDAIVLLQQLEPVGIGARDLRECWMLQTEQDGMAPNQAYLLLEECFEELSNRQFDIISEKLNMTRDEVEDCIQYYQRLSASPGLDLVQTNCKQYIVPDLYLMRGAENYQFDLYYNEQYLPNLVFHQAYYEELKASGDKEVLAYIHEMKQDFNTLVAGLNRRKQILMQITELMVTAQEDFFLSKGYKKQELTLKDLAKASSLQLSIIRAAIKDKYLYTDFGIFSYSDLLVDID